jgi:K+-transporting ATPase c subunit
MPVETVLCFISKHPAGRSWRLLGEKVVNVLELNLDLDQQT